MADKQMQMLRETYGRYGVEIRGAGSWAIARALVRDGLAVIDGDPGQELPAMLWATDIGRLALEEDSTQ